VPSDGEKPKEAERREDERDARRGADGDEDEAGDFSNMAAPFRGHYDPGADGQRAFARPTGQATPVPPIPQ